MSCGTKIEVLRQYICSTHFLALLQIGRAMNQLCIMDWRRSDVCHFWVEVQKSQWATV